MKQEVKHIIINESNSGQRIDNYLISKLKGVPKSHIYRILRKGEVRVNKKRCKPEYRLLVGDDVRIPPINLAERIISKPTIRQSEWLESLIIYEDKQILVLNKPAGVAVHAGSGIDLGIIEILRYEQRHGDYLELVHRLDKETSGCLLLVKERSILKDIHKAFQEKTVEKQYLSLVKGILHSEREVSAHLKSYQQAGERMVGVDEQGKFAHTVFKPLRKYQAATLVSAQPSTGRTHQIRVHAAYINHPIAGDKKYGDRQLNKQLQKIGLSRLFLHAFSLKLPQNLKLQQHCFEVSLTSDLQQALNQLT